MSARKLQSRMKNLLLFVPNMVLLSGRLMIDPRVPARERLLVAGAIVYAIMPMDLIPDMLPFVGQIDDAYLIALTLLRLMTITDPAIVREHWRGGGDVVELIGSTAIVAAKLLPKRIRRVLTSRVESPGGGLSSKSPLLVERPVAESKTDASGSRPS
ncbi:MAG TPA: YkvA family protein [Pyrinomonadaceae bacterium]|nr:YkvA family protein [Pyrinomonadaceae bacterium]